MLESLTYYGGKAKNRCPSQGYLSLDTLNLQAWQRDQLSRILSVAAVARRYSLYVYILLEGYIVPIKSSFRPEACIATPRVGDERQDLLPQATCDIQ